MDRYFTQGFQPLVPTGTEGSVLTQVQLLSGSSTWLLLVSAPHIVTGGVSLLDGKLHGMQSGGATQPLFSSSGSGEPSTNT